MSLVLDRISVVQRGRAVLDAISLTVSPGELVALIGPNGAGKSTIMRAAAGLLRPCSGSVTLDGEGLAGLSPRALAARRAMLMQDQSMEARFSVRELAAFGVSDQLRSSDRGRLGDLVTRTLQDVGLDCLAERDITSLSGGERQRAHLARVLVQLRWHGDEGYLLLDEPVSAQDIARQGQILSLARAHTGKGGPCPVSSCRRGGCLAVLHDLNWASAFADRIVVIDGGRIHSDGPASAVMTSGMLADVFGLTDHVLGYHARTGRPFILPHDLAPPGSLQTTEG